MLFVLLGNECVLVQPVEKAIDKTIIPVIFAYWPEALKHTEQDKLTQHVKNSANWSDKKMESSENKPMLNRSPRTGSVQSCKQRCSYLARELRQLSRNVYQMLW